LSDDKGKALSLLAKPFLSLFPSARQADFELGKYGAKNPPAGRKLFQITIGKKVYSESFQN